MPELIIIKSLIKQKCLTFIVKGDLKISQFKIWLTQTVAVQSFTMIR